MRGWGKGRGRVLILKFRGKEEPGADLLSSLETTKAENFRGIPRRGKKISL
jgi:hypothetical protein